MRYIDCEVNDEYVQGSGVVIGAEGSHNDVALRLTFGDMWIGLNIYATFTDAQGSGSAVVMLMPSMLVPGEAMTYLLPIPADAKKYPGKAMLTLSGFSVINGTQVDKATNTVTAYFRVLKSDYKLLDGSKITPTIEEQIFSEINKLGERAEEAETDIADIRADMADIEDKIDKIQAPDSNIPEWALQPEKPSYSKEEVGLANVDNVKQYSASNPPPYPVTSVNGQGGNVSLGAGDVGAMPAGTKIPAKTSDITNDSGFITKAVSDLANYYTKSQTFTRDEINAKISAIPKFAIEVVSSLPTSNISATTVYLVGGGSGNDLYTEYIYVNGKWEFLGAQTVDLTGYATETWVITQLGDYIKQSELEAAINSALAAAKASGEFKGDKGDKGDQGERGLQGEQGVQGIQGVPGDKGDKGDTGAQGIQGVQGEKGEKGDKGDTGAQGLQGVQGIQGEKGEKGEKGETGAKGEKGDPFSIAKIYPSVAAMNAGYASDGVAKGAFVVIDTGNVDDEENARLYIKGDSAYVFLTDLSGAQGIKGDKGDKGDQGEKGETGAKGDQGIQGIQGIQGEKGDKGDKGDKGEQGIQGIQGEKGDKGDTGAKGDQGIQGIQGVKGDTGAAGKDGADGKDYILTEADKTEIAGMSGGVIIPEYWQNELDTKADAIQAAMEKAGRHKSAFLWYTDAHWVNGNSKVSPKLLNYLYMNTPMNKVNFGGDIIGDTLLATREEMKYLYEWRKAIKDLPNHHSVFGNHDMFNLDTVDYEDDNYRYAFLLAPEESYDQVWGNGNYYYIDNPAEKTRYLYICYPNTDTTWLLTQTQFIANSLNSTPEGWHIVAIAHRWWQYSKSSTPTVGSIPSFEKDILSVFDAYNARAKRNGSNYFYAQDFTEGKATVEFCIGGHIHVDYDFFSDGGIPVIITTADTNQNRVPDSTVDSGTTGTITEAAVFGIIADYNDIGNTKITVVGVGRGTSRVVRASNIKPLSITNISYSGDTTIGATIDKNKFSFTVKYSNGTTDTVNGATSASPATIGAVGNNSVTITYTEGATTLTASATIVGTPVPVVNLLNLNRTYVSGTAGETLGLSHLDESKAYTNVAYGNQTFNASSSTASDITENSITVKESGIGGITVAYPIHLTDIAVQDYKITFDYSGTGKCRTYCCLVKSDGTLTPTKQVYVNDTSGASGSADVVLKAADVGVGANNTDYEWLIIMLSSNTGGTKTYSNVSLTKA